MCKGVARLLTDMPYDRCLHVATQLLLHRSYYDRGAREQSSIAAQYKKFISGVECVPDTCTEP